MKQNVYKIIAILAMLLSSMILIKECLLLLGAPIPKDQLPIIKFDYLPVLPPVVQGPSEEPFGAYYNPLLNRIYVNRWSSLSGNEKKWLIYHELGHALAHQTQRDMPWMPIAQDKLGDGFVYMLKSSQWLKHSYHENFAQLVALKHMLRDAKEDEKMLVWQFFIAGKTQGPDILHQHAALIKRVKGLDIQQIEQADLTQLDQLSSWSTWEQIKEQRLEYMSLCTSGLINNSVLSQLPLYKQSLLKTDPAYLPYAEHWAMMYNKLGSNKSIDPLAFSKEYRQSANYWVFCH